MDEGFGVLVHDELQHLFPVLLRRRVQFLGGSQLQRAQPKRKDVHRLSILVAIPAAIGQNTCQDLSSVPTGLTSDQ